MIAWLLYSGITVGAGFLLALLVGLVKGGAAKQNGSPLGGVALCIALAVGGPFVYVEALTAAVGKPMADAVKKCYAEAPIRGPMQYYRVTSYTPDHASVLVVGEEPAIWKGKDRPIMRVSLIKKNGAWKADTFQMLYSDRLNKDGLVFPPYH